MTLLTVSQLAKAADVKPDTIRFYEKEGLLAEPERSASGYRLFDAEAVERMQFIRSSQAMGLKLASIKELLEIRDLGQCPCGHTADVVARRLKELSEEIARLKKMRAQLLSMQSSSVRETERSCCPTGE